MNRLQNEKSPYLLQHATNPVDWYPWGAEAFAKAKEEEKPVFLSIGYSTCHWCHVMAHESFEDADVAEALNRDYIAIKVDREERPDIDAVYMSVCQMLTGSGGWPLTILMTPDQKPFWAGTYLPKTGFYGRIGMMELLGAVKQQWEADQDKLILQGDQITSFLQADKAVEGERVEPKPLLLQKAVDGFKSIYDTKWSGFGMAPKFPTPHNLLFLMQYSLLEQDAAALEMAEQTLTQMFRGGIFDHLGGGFSRYSTDEKWLIPHFEKMLYDNALLAYAYLEAFHITRQPFYRMVAERVLEYVLQELTDTQGGFYCGQDADSDGVEGKFYVFTKEEIDAVFGQPNADRFCDWFGVTPKGNFEGKNILNLLENPQYQQVDSEIESLSKKLCAYRLERTRLHKDDKVLTSWNALMIAAFAKAARLLHKAEYLKAAQNAQCFLQNSLMDEKGNLKVRWREGETAHDGQLDDYAFYAFALLELYETTFQVEYLQKAIQIADQMLLQFWDDEQGGLFLYSKDSEQLISRPKETYDGAIPSGNSVAAVVFESLAKYTGEIRWQQTSYQQLCFLTKVIQEHPVGYSMALLAISKAVYPSRELVCVTAGTDTPQELLSLLAERVLVNLTVLVKTSQNQEQLTQLASFTESYPIPESGSMYYLCQNGACSAPVNSLEELLKQLHS